MSREFGSYMNGYFHQQIQQGADDCKSGRDEITRLWGEFLEEFSHIAYAIASSEACDSGVDYPIFETMEKLPALEKRLNEIKSYIEPFYRVAQEAVRKKAETK